jgi:hypothetical protein
MPLPRLMRSGLYQPSIHAKITLLFEEAR